MTKKAAGKAHREGITIVQLMDMFPTEEAATTWFESVIWPDGRHCPKCGSKRTCEASHKKMPYWCSDCRSYFSIKTSTAMHASKIPLRKWAIAIYLALTSLKSVSSMKLHRDIGVSQATAWFMIHRIREAWGGENDQGPFDGPVEFDETYMGGKRKNKSNAQRKIAEGRGPVDMTAVVGAKDRATNKVNAKVIADTGAKTLQGFVANNASVNATVFTDDAAAYEGIPNPHESVKHSISEFVTGMAHTNGIESFWSMLKRAHKGIFHKIRSKATAKLCLRVCRQAQHEGLRNACPNARHRCPSCRPQAASSRLDRMQWTVERGGGVGVPRGGIGRALASQGSHPQGQPSGRVSGDTSCPYCLSSKSSRDTRTPFYSGH